MTATRGNPMLIGAVLIIGAIMYSKRATAQRTGATVARPMGTGSMPGSTGTGVNQMVGGAVAGMLQSIAGGFSNSAYWNNLRTPDYLPNMAMQEVAWDSASPNVIVPASLSDTGIEQIWTVG